ncbi:hypothetical protein D3C73_1279900 [compost metagenome]
MRAGKLGVCVDCAADLRNSGGVGDGEIALVVQGNGAGDGQLAAFVGCEDLFFGQYQGVVISCNCLNGHVFVSSG